MSQLGFERKKQPNLWQDLGKQLSLGGAGSPHAVKEDRHLLHHLERRHG